MDLQINKLLVNILIVSLLMISCLCSSLHAHRKLMTVSVFEDGDVAAVYSESEDVQDYNINLDGATIRRLIDVEAMLDYENPGSNTRHQPGRGRGPRTPRF